MIIESTTVMLKAAVIGAGPSGLAAIKSCKEEDIDVVCFEKTESYGGIWSHLDTSDNNGSISKCSFSLFSKEMEAYSDFPPSENSPNYPNYISKLSYLKSYVENFKLLPHIRFNKNVFEVKQTENFESTGQWIVKFTDIESNSVTEEIFDCIFICTGRSQFPYAPQFTDQEIFRGKIIHSKDLKSFHECRDLNVLIVGFGNSAVETAVTVSNEAKQVFLSVRTGRWVVPKLGKRGFPSDTQYLRRHISALKKMFPNRVNSYWENVVTSKLDHEKYKIKPDLKVLQRMPIINDDIPDKILTARVIIKDEISRFTEDGVIFKNDETVTQIDCVILATGYETKLPFLEERFWTTYNKTNNLYKYVFSVGTNRHSLAVIGQVQSHGPLTPIAESQCRWASLVFKKKLTLPSQQEMVNDIKFEASELKKWFPLSSKQCPDVDYINYMDEIAFQYGAKPNAIGLLMTDPKLFYAYYFGPCLPYQYRIQGPNNWIKAREAILNAEERIMFPLKSNSAKPTQPSKCSGESLAKSKNMVFAMV